MAKKVISCLGSKLNKIVNQTEQVNYINELITAYLPKHLAKHTHVTGFVNGVLQLSIDNPTLASELRFHLPNIRDNLRTQHKLYYLSTIKILSTTTPIMYKKNKHVKKTVLSTKKAAQTLRNNCRDMDDELANALKKLANSIEDR